MERCKARIRAHPGWLTPAEGDGVLAPSPFSYSNMFPSSKQEGSVYMKLIIAVPICIIAGVILLLLKWWAES